MCLMMFFLPRDGITEDLYWNAMSPEGNRLETIHYCIGSTTQEVLFEDKYIIGTDDSLEKMILADIKPTREGKTRLYLVNKNGKIEKKLDCYLPDMINIIALTGQHIYYIAETDDVSFPIVRRMDRQFNAMQYRLSDFSTFANISVSPVGYLSYDGIVAPPDNTRDVYLEDLLPKEYGLDTDCRAASAWLNDTTLLFWAYKKESPISKLIRNNNTSYLMCFDLNNNVVEAYKTDTFEPLCIEFGLISDGMCIDTASNSIYLAASESSNGTAKDNYSLLDIRYGLKIVKVDLNSGASSIVCDPFEMGIPRNSRLVIIH